MAGTLNRLQVENTAMIGVHGLDIMLHLPPFAQSPSLCVSLVPLSVRRCRIGPDERQGVVDVGSLPEIRLQEPIDFGALIPVHWAEERSIAGGHL